MNIRKAYFTYVDENNTLRKISYVIPYNGTTKQMSIYQIIRAVEANNSNIHILPSKDENS